MPEIVSVIDQRLGVFHKLVPKAIKQEEDESEIIDLLKTIKFANNVLQRYQ